MTPPNGKPPGIRLEPAPDTEADADALASTPKSARKAKGRTLGWNAHRITAATDALVLRDAVTKKSVPRGKARTSPPIEESTGPRMRVDTEEWRALLLTKTVRRGDDEFQIVLATSENVATILRYHLKWRDVIAYDAFSEAVVTTKPPPWHPADAPSKVTAGEWSEADSARAAHWLARVEGMHVSPKLVDQAVAVVADASIIHPAQDYLREVGARWDGKRRLDALLPVYFGTDDTPYSRGIGSRWMISAVARIFRPGCQVDCTLIIEGAQGRYKTSGFRALVPVPTWYADTGINLGDKDSFQNLRGVWLYGLDELDSLRRGDVTRTKNFLTQTFDRYRPSFGRRARSFPRQTVFCGTTNDDQYLHDKTGNRRLWPDRVRRDVDVAAIARDRDQLWAEAVVRFESGEKWYVDTPEFRRLCEEQQADRVAPDAWESIVAAWLVEPHETEWEEDEHTGKRVCRRYPYDTSKGVLTTDVLLYALKKPAKDIVKGDQMRAAEVLRTLGYVRGPKLRENGAQVHRYLKVAPVSRDGGPTSDSRNDAGISQVGTPGTPDHSHTRDGDATTFHAGPVEEIQTAIRGGPGVPSSAGDEAKPGCFDEQLTPAKPEILREEGIEVPS